MNPQPHILHLPIETLLGLLVWERLRRLRHMHGMGFQVVAKRNTADIQVIARLVPRTYINLKNQRQG